MCCQQNAFTVRQALSPKKELSTEYMKQLNTDSIKNTAQPDAWVDVQIWK
jgi:hypothetical protein